MTLPRPLVRLARAYGVAVSYRGADGRQRRVSPDALVAVLRALGAGLEHPDGAAAALRDRLEQRRSTLVEPVIVAWDGGPPAVAVRTDPDCAAEPVMFELALEEGSVTSIDGAACALDVGVDDDVESDVHDTAPSVVRRFTLPNRLPLGAHRLQCRTGGRVADAVVLAAPLHAEQFPTARAWGVFAPVYALRTRRDDPLPGDLADLAALADLVAELGGSVVGTLPLLAAFLDDPYEPSPYSPVSRRFWNEVYVDTGTPVPATDADGLVDLRAALAQKRRVLEDAVASGAYEATVRAFVSRRPDVDRYARFRAAAEQHGVDWTAWPASWRTAGIPDHGVDQARVHYHRCAQALVDEQLGALADRMRARHEALYLDFPLGTHRRGYDVWDQPGLFADDASVGAPPDRFFSKGQDWGFPPVHPEASRADAHAHFAACIEHHLTRAGLLRIDHVIGLHRMWWIPPGHDAADGAFVHYPADELYARLCLASVRHHAALIGENLGTVPPEVNRALRRHRIGGMHIVQFEIDPHAPGGVHPPPPRALTSLDTHDTATFAAFWTGEASVQRLRLGVSTPEEVDNDRAESAKVREQVLTALRDAGLLHDGFAPPGTREVMAALLELLGRSRAQIVLVSLEDLWSELHAQNMPGTVAPENWRRPAALALDEVAGTPELVDVLRRLAAVRAGGKRAGQRTRTTGKEFRSAHR